MVVAMITASSSLAAVHSAADWSVSSPDGKIHLTVRLTETKGSPQARLEYTVSIGDAAVLESSPMGIVRKDAGFEAGLSLVSAGDVTVHDSTYTVPHGKRHQVRDRYNERVLTFQNATGRPGRNPSPRLRRWGGVSLPIPGGKP